MIVLTVVGDETNSDKTNARGRGKKLLSYQIFLIRSSSHQGHLQLIFILQILQHGTRILC